MSKLWEGRTDGIINKAAEDFNSSVGFDCRMYVQDITGSIAHTKMLAKCQIITISEAEKIIDGLNSILADIQNGKLKIDLSFEDIHTFVEVTLIDRIGDTGKKLHTARSRNDQVALDLRMYLRDEIDQICELLKKMTKATLNKAEEYKTAIMPGYTHLQRAQPITFAQQLLAYCMMFTRDISRLEDCKGRLNVSPIGSCALAGTTYNTDRIFEAETLGFYTACMNSIDGVSDRDFCVELSACISIIMMHLSRFAEEVILWSTSEFSFVKLSDEYTTGSSIMPQKKNPDMAELVRGKTGRVYGNLFAILTTLKGIPLAYNKDMQEDKEGIFDSCDTVKACLTVFSGLVEKMVAKTDNMKLAAQKGFINATDLADYFVSKGMPFRDAYKISGQIVERCVKEDKVLETLPIEVYKEYFKDTDNKVYDFVDIENCANKRNSLGGTSPASVEKQIEYVKELLK